MAYLITTEVEIQQKSGANVNTAFDTAMMEASELRGVAVMSAFSRYNWAASPLSISTVTGILSDTASSFVAIEAINYDMSGYTSRSEAETMINVLRDSMIRNLSILKDMKNEKWIKDNAT